MHFNPFRLSRAFLEEVLFVEILICHLPPSRCWRVALVPRHNFASRSPSPCAVVVVVVATTTSTATELRHGKRAVERVCDEPFSGFARFLWPRCEGGCHVEDPRVAPPRPRRCRRRPLALPRLIYMISLARPGILIAENSSIYDTSEASAPAHACPGEHLRIAHLISAQRHILHRMRATDILPMERIQWLAKLIASSFMYWPRP